VVALAAGHIDRAVAAGIDHLLLLEG